MHKVIVRDLIIAQLCFFGCLSIAIMMTTIAFVDNNGLSYYAKTYPTSVPVGLGFFLCFFFLQRAASRLPVHNPPFDKLQQMLRLVAVFLLLVMLTPDSLSQLFQGIHMAVSTTLFYIEFIIAVWLTVKWHGGVVMWSLVVAMGLSGAVAFLSTIELMPYLAHSCLAYQLLFGVFLVLSTSKLIRGMEMTDSATKLVETM